MGRIYKNCRKECKYKSSYYTTSNWGYNNYSPPISVVIKACDDLGEDYFKYLPDWATGLLWVHKKIDEERLEAIRGKDPLLNLQDIASLVQQKLK
jgi:hypothetical protein